MSHYPKDVPFELPDGWVWCKIGDIADVARGGSPRPIDSYLTDDSSGVNWIKIGDAEQGGKYINSTRQRIKKEGVSRSRFVHSGDFLLTNSMSFGRPYIINVDGCIHDGWLVISPINNALHKDYFYYLLSSDYAYQQFSEQASGAVVSNLNKDKVAGALIPLPSVSEQKRIVDAVEKWLSILDLIDDGQSKLYELADDAKEKVLNLAIHGKLVAQDPSDEPAIELLKRINPAFQPSHNLHYTGVIPDGWQICRLSDLFKVTMGQSPDGTSLNRSTGIEFHQGKVCFTEKYLSESDIFTTSATKCAEPNSLLCCVRAPVGVFNITSRRICIGRGLCSLSPLDVDVNIEYWFYALSSLTEYYESVATGSTFKAISGAIIRDTVIAVPPKREQQRILEQITCLFSILKETSDAI